MRLKRIQEVEVPIGMYLVRFNPVWGTQCNEGKHDDCLQHGCLDNEPSYIAEVDGELNKVTTKNWQALDVVGLTVETNSDFYHDDTHDSRDRIFKTKAEAKAHLEYTLKRFKNPSPWESFVKL